MNFPGKPLEGDQSSRKSFKLSRLFSAMAIVITASLAACGGGSSGGSAPTATVSGTVTDGPISGATVYFTSGAPYGISGASLLGQTTANSSGQYTLTFSPPSGTTPVFVTGEGKNSLGQSVQLSSFVGPGSQITGTVASNNLPSLSPTQVTTASLLAYNQNGGNYSNITQATYKTTVQNLETQIIDLAAIVQDLVDQTDSGCALSSGNSVSLSNLASLLTGTTSITSATNIIQTALANLSSSCSSATITSNASVIEGSPTYVTQLSGTGTTVQSSGSLPPGVTAGTYTGIITSIQTGCSPTPATGCSMNNGSNSFEAQMTLSSSGGLSFNGNPVSGENNGTGSTTLSGSNFTLTVTNTGSGSGGTASGTLTSAGNSDIAINGVFQETNSGTIYYNKFSGTFYPGTTLPSNIPAPTVNTNSSSGSGFNFTCSSGTPFFLGGPNDPTNNPLYGLGIPVCVTGTSNGFTMTFPTSNVPCVGTSNGTGCAPVPSAFLPGSTITFTPDPISGETGIYTSGVLNAQSYQFALNYIAGTNDIVLTYCSLSSTSGGFAQCSTSSPTSFASGYGNTSPTVSNNLGWNTTNINVNGGNILN